MARSLSCFFMPKQPEAPSVMGDVPVDSPAAPARPSQVCFDVEEQENDAQPRVSMLTNDDSPHRTSRTIRSSRHTAASKSTQAGLRSGVRLNHADPLQVAGANGTNNTTGDNMSKTTPHTVRAKDIVRIFTSDSVFIEVSPEQLERVKKMHARMEEGATANFNYNTLLLVASVLAALGLVSDSSTTIIGSMLVSPIMGPVVGLAYGSTIRDWKLVWKSLVTEMLSLIFCIVIGVTIGAVTGITDLAYNWPTAVSTKEGHCCDVGWF